MSKRKVIISLTITVIIIYLLFNYFGFLTPSHVTMICRTYNRGLQCMDFSVQKEGIINLTLTTSYSPDIEIINISTRFNECLNMGIIPELPLLMETGKIYKITIICDEFKRLKRLNTEFNITFVTDNTNNSTSLRLERVFIE